MSAVGSLLLGGGRLLPSGSSSLVGLCPLLVTGGGDLTLASLPFGLLLGFLGGQPFFLANASGVSISSGQFLQVELSS